MNTAVRGIALMLLGGLGSFADAAAAFERSTTLEGGNPLSWFNLGLARLRAGNKVGAAAAFRKTLALKPDFSEARKLLGEATR